MGASCCCQPYSTDSFQPIPPPVTSSPLPSTQISKLGPGSFDSIKLIGRGQSGRVFLVRKKSTGSYFAMKVLKKKDIKRNNQRAHTITERNILMQNSSPFIVQLRYSFQDSARIYLVMDFEQGGELFFHLRRQGSFKEEKARFYAAEITLAIEYLHSQGIMYRDLKPENVLLDVEGHVKLTDFGLSKVGMSGNSAKTYTLCGTPEYLAPEIIKKEGYGFSVDFWSLGTLIYEMLSGLSPFFNVNKNTVFNNVLNRSYEVKSYFSRAAADIIEKLLTVDPQERFNNGQNIKNHEFFEGIDWTKLEKREIKPPFLPEVTGDMDVTHFDKKYTQQVINDSLYSASNIGSYYQDFTFMYDEKK